MKFKNALEMWHKYLEFLEHLVKTARFQEIHLIHQCIHYVLDDACEEYCRCPKHERKEDWAESTPIISGNECWKCPFFEVSK